MSATGVLVLLCLASIASFIAGALAWPALRDALTDWLEGVR